MKSGVVILTLSFLTAPILLNSCGGKKEQAQQELETSGYEATPEDFLRAAESGDVRALELFAKQDIAMDTKDENGWTALHLAARARKQESAAFLIEKGLSVDTKGLDGVTPLMLAAREGHHTMVRYLLKQGASAGQKDDKKRTALILAIDANSPACIAELAPYSRNGLDTALLYAAAQGKSKVIETLTSFGASVYVRHEGGMTPLMLAAQKGHTNTVNALLENGANRYAVNEHGWTASQVAAAAGKDDMVKIIDQEPGGNELTLGDSGDPEQGIAWEERPLPTPNLQEPSNTLEETAAQPAQLPTKNTKTIPFIAGKTIPAEPSTVLPPVASLDNSEPETATTPLNKKPLRMVDYRSRPLPLMVEKTQPSSSGGSEAEVRMLYGKQKKVTVREGDTIPNTRFKVTSIRRMLNHSKMTDGKPTDVSVVEIEDTATGKRRKMTTRIPATAEDPWAVLEAGTDRHYAARAGQTFRSASGTEYTVTDVRPTQIILTSENGKTITIPLGR